MAFTRDSALLYLGLVGTVIAYVVASPKDLGDWNTRDYLQACLLAVSWLTGKLQTSQLPHSTEGSARVTASRK